MLKERRARAAAVRTGVHRVNDVPMRRVVLKAADHAGSAPRARAANARRTVGLSVSVHHGKRGVAAEMAAGSAVAREVEAVNVQVTVEDVDPGIVIGKSVSHGNPSSTWSRCHHRHRRRCLRGRTLRSLKCWA
jgi:hypothetical protein